VAAAGKVAREGRAGADAERTQHCRIVGYVNGIQAYWKLAMRGYTVVPTEFFSGHTHTRCGPATSQAGPITARLGMTEVTVVAYVPDSWREE